MINQIPLRKQTKVKLLEKVLTQNRRLAEVQKMLYKNKSQMIKHNNSETIKIIAQNDQQKQQSLIIPKEDKPQVFYPQVGQDVKPLQHKSKMFKNQYSKHIDFVLQKNPEYFEHLAGRCKCYKTDWHQRCSGMDQNYYQRQNSQFTSTYGKDFFQSQSLCNSKDAQLKSDPYYSSFYDSGSKKQFMNSSTISQCDYQKRNCSLNKLNAQNKADLYKGTISLEQSPQIPPKTHYNINEQV